jgi:hypothetical protein
MHCSSFDRWLDEGRPVAERTTCMTHAAACRRCAGALEAAQALDLALSRRFATAPDAFTDRVLARLPSRAAKPAVVATLDLEPAIPWWVALMREPLVVVSVLLGILFFGVGPFLWSRGESWIEQGVQAADESFLSLVDRAAAVLPATEWILAMMMVLPSILVGWFLFRRVQGWGAPNGLSGPGRE